MSRRFRSTLPGVVTCAAMVAIASLSGCGGSAGPTAQTPDEAPTAVSASTDVAELRILTSARIATTDPLLVTNSTDCHVMHLVGGTLRVITPDGKSTTAGLAAEGRFGPDLRTYTATLRPGLEFSDGTPLTSADVVATFQRALDSKSNAYAGEYEPIKSVRAKDRKTVLFTFDRPYRSFETMLAFPEFTILKRSEIGANGEIPANPTFAGRYTVEGDVTKNSFTLVRNENYGATKPAVGTLSFRVMPDGNTRLQQVTTGQADFTYDLPVRELTNLRGSAKGAAPPGAIFFYLALNNSRGPTSDVGVRKAISLAVDREQISKVAWAGKATPISDFFSTTMLGYESWPVKQDIEAARAALKGTECEQGCSFTLLSDNSEVTNRTNVVVQNNLKEIGIKVDITKVDAATSTQRLVEGNYDIAVSFFGGYFDLPELMPAYCMSDTYGFESCLSHYESTKANRLVDRAVKAQSKKELKQAYADLNQQFKRDVPFVTVTDYLNAFVVSEKASGVIAQPQSLLWEIAPRKRG